MMAIRYLRRPPKPVDRANARKSKRGVDKLQSQRSSGSVSQAPPEVLPQERAAMAQALAYFCVVCGREHVTGGVRESDICNAESQLDAVIHGESS